MAQVVRTGLPAFLIPGGLPPESYRAARTVRRELHLSWRQVTALAFTHLLAGYNREGKWGREHVTDLADKFREVVQ